MGNQTVPAFHQKPSFLLLIWRQRKAFCVVYYEEGGGGEKQADSNAFTRVDGGSSVRKAHCGGRFLILCLARCLCTPVDVQQCSREECGREEEEEAVNAPSGAFLTSDRRNRRQDRPAMRLQPSHRGRQGQSWSWS